jgi:hypothetical protein
MPPFQLQSFINSIASQFIEQMVNPNRFYTYAYLRKDGTPYYIGKGNGKRAYSKNHSIFVPPNERILFLKKNLLEEEAYQHEIYMIAILGRKDLGTGILHNKTNGGDGTKGMLLTEEKRNQISERQLGEKNNFYGKNHTLETRRKMSESQSGENHAMYGKKHKLESRQKISAAVKGENHPLYQKGHSEKSKNKMKESSKKNYKITYVDGSYELIKGIENWIIENKMSKYYLKKLKKGEIKEYKNIISIEKIIL